MHTTSRDQSPSTSMTAVSTNKRGSLGLFNQSCIDSPTDAQCRWTTISDMFRSWRKHPRDSPSAMPNKLLQGGDSVGEAGATTLDTMVWAQLPHLAPASSSVSETAIIPFRHDTGSSLSSNNSTLLFPHGSASSDSTFTSSTSNPRWSNDSSAPTLSGTTTHNSAYETPDFDWTGQPIHNFLYAEPEEIKPGYKPLERSFTEPTKSTIPSDPLFSSRKRQQSSPAKLDSSTKIRYQRRWNLERNKHDFICPEEDDVFPHKSGFYRHLKYDHGQVSYVCDFCGKEIIRTDNLARHRNTLRCLKFQERLTNQIIGSEVSPSP